ncbi:MAG: metallophosphoesterase family protein [Cytophagales bacterium]
MSKILLLSDTHHFINPRIESFAKNVDQIWHAGDVGAFENLDSLRQWKEVKAVWGNIDGGDLRKEIPKNLFFELEGCKILMTHIAGKMGVYNQETRDLIIKHKPNVLVCGHSHILKVAFDSKFNLLYMNPGAAGNHGFHQISTFLLLEVSAGKPQDLKVVELGKRGSIA